MNQKEEEVLRENIRHLIKFVKNKRRLEEQKIKNSIKELAELELAKMLQEREVADTDPSPNKSTGINVLEDLLKKIIPILEPDYKSLTTNKEQRASFRAHIVNAIVNTLTPVEINDEAGDSQAEDLEEEIEVTLADEEASEDQDKFIDIFADEKKEEEEEVEVDPRDAFGIEGEDETGRNMAYNTFNKIETSIIDSYELLSNSEDQELFYDYLIANVKLYFDKFEEELMPDVAEPSNQAYDSAKRAEKSSVDDLALQEMVIEL